MSQLKVGDRVKVKDRPGWPGGYKIANRPPLTAYIGGGKQVL